MLLNIVSTIVLSLALGFFSTTSVKADDTFFDDIVASNSDENQDFPASNVLSENNFDSTDEEDEKTNGQHLYSLDDDDDDDFD